MIDHNNRLIFVHVPKCGGSSVEAAIAAANGLKADWVCWPTEHLDFFFMARNRQHYPLSALLEEVPPGVRDSYRVIALVRDPVARAASEFRYLQENRGLWGQEGIDYDDFPRAITSGDLFTKGLRCHAQPAAWFLDTDHQVEIFRLEDGMGELEATLSDIYRKPVEIPHLEKSGGSTSAAVGSLTPEALEILDGAWGCDCALGGYVPIPERLTAGAALA